MLNGVTSFGNAVVQLDYSLQDRGGIDRVQADLVNIACAPGTNLCVLNFQLLHTGTD